MTDYKDNPLWEKGILNVTLGDTTFTMDHLNKMFEEYQANPIKPVIKPKFVWAYPLEMFTKAKADMDADMRKRIFEYKLNNPLPETKMTLTTDTSTKVTAEEPRLYGLFNGEDEDDCIAIYDVYKYYDFSVYAVVYDIASIGWNGEAYNEYQVCDPADAYFKWDGCSHVTEANTYTHMCGIEVLNQYYNKYEGMFYISGMYTGHDEFGPAMPKNPEFNSLIFKSKLGNELTLRRIGLQNITGGADALKAGRKEHKA